MENKTTEQLTELATDMIQECSKYNRCDNCRYKDTECRILDLFGILSDIPAKLEVTELVKQLKEI